MEGPESARTTTSGERWFVALFALLVFGLFALDLLDDFSPAKLTVLFMISGYVLTLVVHEAGHALAASALGWRVCRIVVGFGRTLLRFRIGQVPVDLRLFPASGFVVPAPRQLSNARLKSALIYLAGPASELMLVLLIAGALGTSRLLEPSDEPLVLLAQSLCVVALMGAATNLIPLSTREGAWTDGLGAIRSFSVSDSYYQGLIGTPYAIAAEEKLNRGDRHSAELVLERGLREHPDNLPLGVRLCAGLIEAEAPKTVLAKLEPLLARDDIPKRLQPRILDLLAQALLDIALLYGERRLEEADTYSAHSIELSPSDPWAVLTRAQVLIELGGYHPARTLLLELREASLSHELSRNVALVEVWLDYARGNRADALARLEQLQPGAIDGRLAARVLEVTRGSRR